MLLFYDAEVDGLPHGWVALMKETRKAKDRQFCRAPHGEGVRGQAVFTGQAGGFGSITTQSRRGETAEKAMA